MSTILAVCISHMMSAAPLEPSLTDGIITRSKKSARSATELWSTSSESCAFSCPRRAQPAQWPDAVGIAIYLAFVLGTVQIAIVQLASYNWLAS